MLVVTHRQPIPGRVAPTWRQILNPVWLAGDDLRNQKWPWWRWFLRNNFANLGAVVIGVSHLERATVCLRSPWTYADRGWNAGWTVAAGWRSLFPLPFVSWRGSRIEAAVGWKTSGAWTTALRRANSPNAKDEP